MEGQKKGQYFPKDILPQHLVNASGDQTKTADIVGSKGSVVALYFSASWCPPCVKLSPLLAAIYKEINKTEKKFEIVLVCDEGEAEAKKYFGHMPWLALPHDQESIKKQLFQDFEIEGIPTLIIFEADTGKLISADGIQRIFENGPEAFPWSDEKLKEVELQKQAKMNSKSVEELLATSSRNYLVNNKGEQFPINSLQKDVIGLYFSAHWCPPCKMFTPLLANVYNELRTKNASFEVVFLSSDRSEPEFTEYFATMPWLSVPFSDNQTKQDLSNLYQVQGIPTLVLIDGKTGKLISLDGRSRVMTLKAEGFPFTDESMAAHKVKEDAKFRSLPKTVKTKGHDHDLELVESVYDGNYGCDFCGRSGTGWAYHCQGCGYDVHPACGKIDEVHDQN